MKRVLAIDGGGIRGLIPAIFCNEIEKVTERSISENFDLISGTSTGGIIALGLANGISAKSLIELYLKEGKVIFSKPKGYLKTLARPKYNIENLKNVLGEAFGELRLSDSKTDVMALAYDLSSRKPLCFRSWETIPGSEIDYSLTKIGCATSAAPTYFAPVNISGEKSAIDGGIYCNNPSLVAYVEAKHKWPNEEIILISIGTGSLETSILYSSAKKWGIIDWAFPVLDCVFDGVSKTTNEVLRKISEISSLKLRYYRFQSTLDSSCEKMDNISSESIENLKRIGEALATDSESEIVDIFQSISEVKAARFTIPKNTLDDTSKYLRYSTSDIVLKDLKEMGLNLEYIEISQGFSVYDLVRVCKNNYSNTFSEKDIEQCVFNARAHAFTVKYSEPVEDEKLQKPEEIKFPDLKKWSFYFKSMLLENLISIDHSKILDVGAGHSQANIDLYRNIEILNLVDISEKALAHAKASLPQANIYIENAENIASIKKDSIDIYLSFRTYQSTLFDTRAALHEAYRVLVHKGIFIISIPVMFPKSDGTVAQGLLKPGKDEEQPSMEYANFITESIASKARTLNFRNVRIDRRSPFEFYIIGER